MEKKAPQRNVAFRDDDIFYVYDKRINKCINDDCDGIVKYGLALRVNMPNGDCFNTFACNKCHMKYTPYANYVRVGQRQLLVIKNEKEVAARDLKREKDAARMRNKSLSQGNTLGKKSFRAKNFQSKKIHAKDFRAKNQQY